MLKQNKIILCFLYIVVKLCTFTVQENNFTSSCSDVSTNGEVESRRNDVEDLRVRLYKGPTNCEYSSANLTDWSCLLSTPQYRPDATSLLYIHGYTENPLSSSVKTVVQAHLDRGKENVFIIDWSNLSGPPYFTNAVPNMKKAANATAEELHLLAEKNLFFTDKLHVIGHSLGARYAGFLGKHLKMYDLTLSRITGLDPAGPGFYKRDTVESLDLGSNDTKLVDIIHTDSGKFGTSGRIGTVDFWPNGGYQQPGCPTSGDTHFCNHRRSWRYWAESVGRPDAFVAYPANSYEEFENDACIQNSTSDQKKAYMGIKTDDSTKGDYYLTTNAQSPFGRGEQNSCDKCEHSEDGAHPVPRGLPGPRRCGLCAGAEQPLRDGQQELQRQADALRDRPEVFHCRHHRHQGHHLPQNWICQQRELHQGLRPVHQRQWRIRFHLEWRDWTERSYSALQVTEGTWIQLHPGNLGKLSLITQ